MSGFPVLIFWSGPPGPIWHFCLPAGPLRKLKISQKRNYMPPYCILGAKKHWEMRTLQNVPALTVSLPHNVARPSSSNFQWRWYVHDPQKYFAVVGLAPAVWEWSSKWKTPGFARIILNQKEKKGRMKLKINKSSFLAQKPINLYTHMICTSTSF